jgi:hypothetical protein
MTAYTPPLFDHALDADELNRNLLWKRQLNQRAAWRAWQQTLLAGDPLAALAAQDGVQPLIDHKFDVSLPAPPADPDSVPPSNQDLNT